jgi:hypothetical protein
MGRSNAAPLPERAGCVKAFGGLEETGMRWSLLLAAVVLLLGRSSFGQTTANPAKEKPASSTPEISITVDPPAAPIRVESPVVVTVTVTNISGKEIYLESTRSQHAAYRDFAYLLLKDGHEVETTFFHRKITGRNRPDDPQEVWSGSTILLPHPPGTIYVMKIDLKRLYEIRDPGVYTVEVSRFDEASKTMVRSKAVALKIVP